LHPSIVAKRAWLLLFIAISALYLWGLGSLPLVGPDEPRYAQVAREMLERRDLITPTLGGIPWFEKPPLLYWMMMLSFRFLGVTEYAARLGPALCGLTTAFFVYWAARAIEDPSNTPTETDSGNVERGATARWSTLIWLSSLGTFSFSRAASFDIVLTMTVTGAFAFFLRYLLRINIDESISSKGSPRRRKTALLAGFCLFAGLSILAKGLIGFVIVFGVVALYYLVRLERPRRSLVISLIWGVPLSLVVAGIWFFPMIAKHGWTFIDQFIIQHHFARFISNKYHHPGPIYFYLPVVISFALPWTVVFGAAIISVRRWAWRGQSARDRLRVFALVWLILPITFFSFSGSKLIAYILPVLPAIALLVGERIACALSVGRGHSLVRLTGVTLIVLAAAGYWYVHGHNDLTVLCVIGGTGPLAILGIAALLRPKLRRPLLVLIAVAFIAGSVVVLKCAAPALTRTESVRDLLASATARGYATTPIVQLHVIERTAEFYAPGRLTYQADGEPVKLEGVMQVVEAARRNNGVVLCFVPLQFESQLTSFAGAQTEVIANNGRVVLLAVRVRS
jgi:4-amino-4-deoxy-L-arabinose transferase-like glycosyltransferase